MENTDFATFLNEKVKANGWNAKKLSEATGISLGHIEDLLTGDASKLPSAPYLRGYLIKLGQALDFEPDIWWERFKSSDSIRRAGAGDRLPTNRFALRSLGKYFWLGLLALIVIGYFGFRFSAIFGKPIISMNNPADETVTVKDGTILVSGSVKSGDQLFVNGEAVTLGSDGHFEKTVLLQAGPNPIQLTAKKFLGGETSVIRQVIYEPETKIITPETPTNSSSTN